MIRREIVLPAPREEVWEALTEPERLEDWFANDVELDLRPGGGASFRWSNGEERRATVTEVDPERLLRFEWEDDGARAPGVGARRCLTRSGRSSARSPTRAAGR